MTAAYLGQFANAMQYFTPVKWTIQLCTHTHTHIHTYIYIHTYTFTHIHIHKRTHTHIHTCVHAYLHKNTHTHSPTYIHTYIHTYLKIDSQWCIRNINVYLLDGTMSEVHRVVCDCVFGKVSSWSLSVTKFCRQSDKRSRYKIKYTTRVEA